MATLSSVFQLCCFGEIYRDSCRKQATVPVCKDALHVCLPCICVMNCLVHLVIKTRKITLALKGTFLLLLWMLMACPTSILSPSLLVKVCGLGCHLSALPHAHQRVWASLVPINLGQIVSWLMLLSKCYVLRLRRYRYRTGRKDLVLPQIGEVIYTFLLDSLFHSLEIQGCVRLTVPALYIYNSAQCSNNSTVFYKPFRRTQINTWKIKSPLLQKLLDKTSCFSYTSNLTCPQHASCPGPGPRAAHILAH